MRVKVSLKEYNRVKASLENQRIREAAAATTTATTATASTSTGSGGGESGNVQDTSTTTTASTEGDVGGSITSSASRRGSLDEIIASLGVDNHELTTFDLLSGDFDFFGESDIGSNMPPGENKAPTPHFSGSLNEGQGATSASFVQKVTPPSTSTRKQRRKQKKKKANKKTTTYENPLLILMKAAQQLSPNFMLPILSNKLPALETSPSTSQSEPIITFPDEEEVPATAAESIADHIIAQQNVSSPEASVIMVEPSQVIPLMTSSHHPAPPQVSTATVVEVAPPRRTHSTSSASDASTSPFHKQDSPQRGSQSAPLVRRTILFSPEPLFAYSSGEDEGDKQASLVAPASYVIESLAPLYKEFEENNLNAIVQRNKRLPSFHAITKRRLPRSVFVEVDGSPANGAKRYKVDGDEDPKSMEPLVRKKRNFFNIPEMLLQQQQFQQQPLFTFPYPGQFLPQYQQVRQPLPSPVSPFMPQQQFQPQQQQQRPPISLTPTPMSNTQQQQVSAPGSPVSPQRRVPPNLLPRPPQSQSAGPVPFNYQAQQPRPSLAGANQWQSPQTKAMTPLQQQLARAPINTDVGGGPNLMNDYKMRMQDMQSQPSTPKQTLGSPTEDTLFKAPLPVVNDRQKLGILIRQSVNQPVVTSPSQSVQPQQRRKAVEVLAMSLQGNLPAQQQWPTNTQQYQRPQYPLQQSQLSPTAPNRQYQYPVTSSQPVIPQQQQQYPSYNQQQQSQYPAQQYYRSPESYSSYAPTQAPARQSPYSYLGNMQQSPMNLYQNQIQQQRLQQTPQVPQLQVAAQIPQLPVQYPVQPLSPYPLPYYGGSVTSPVSSYYGNGPTNRGYPPPGGTVYSQPSVRVPPSSSYTPQQQMPQQPYQMQNRLYADPFSKGTLTGYGGGNGNVISGGGGVIARQGTATSTNPYSLSQVYPTVGTPVQPNLYTTMEQQQRYAGGQQSNYPSAANQQQQYNYQQQQPQQSYYGPFSIKRPQYPQYQQQQQRQQQQQQQQERPSVATVDPGRSRTPQIKEQNTAVQPQQLQRYYFPSPGQYGGGGRGSSAYSQPIRSDQSTIGNSQQKQFGPIGERTITGGEQYQSGGTVSQPSGESTAKYVQNVSPDISGKGGNSPGGNYIQDIYSAYNLEKSTTTTPPPPTTTTTSTPPEIISGGETVLFRPKSTGPPPQTDGLGGSGRGGGTQGSGGTGEGRERGAFTLPIIDRPEAKTQIQKQNSQAFAEPTTGYQKEGQSETSGKQKGQPDQKQGQSDNPSERFQSSPGPRQETSSASGGGGGGGSRDQPGGAGFSGGDSRIGLSHQQQRIPESRGGGGGHGSQPIQLGGQYGSSGGGGGRPGGGSGGGGDGGGNVTAGRGNSDSGGLIRGQPEHLPKTGDKTDSNVGNGSRPAWGQAGNRDDHGGKGSSPGVHQPTGSPSAVQADPNDPSRRPGEGGEEENVPRKHLPHHGGDMPFYSQREIDAHHQRVSQNAQTVKDSEFENDSTILSWYLQRAKQKLRDRQAEASHIKPQEAAPMGSQTTGKGPSDGTEVRPAPIQQGNSRPAPLHVATSHVPVTFPNKSEATQHSAQTVADPSATSYDRGLSSVSYPSPVVQTPANTSEIHGSASPSGFNYNANQNGLSPLSRAAASSPTPSSSDSSSHPPNIPGRGPHPGIGRGSGIHQPDGVRNNGIPANESDPHRIPEHHQRNAGRAKRTFRDPYSWYFP